MTMSVFGLLGNQAIAAPYWADLTYDTVSSITSLYLFSITKENIFAEFYHNT
jgi:hypothetical protein